MPAVNEILSGGYLVRESDEDVSNNTNYRAGVVDRSEGRLASVGLIKISRNDMPFKNELIPFKFCSNTDKIIPGTAGTESKLLHAIKNVDPFSGIGGELILSQTVSTHEDVYVLQVVTTTADPVVGSLEQLEQKSP